MPSPRRQPAALIWSFARATAPTHPDPGAGCANGVIDRLTRNRPSRRRRHFRRAPPTGTTCAHDRRDARRNAIRAARHPAMSAPARNVVLMNVVTLRRCTSRRRALPQAMASRARISWTSASTARDRRDQRADPQDPSPPCRLGECIAARRRSARPSCGARRPNRRRCRALIDLFRTSACHHRVTSIARPYRQTRACRHRRAFEIEELRDA